MTEPTTVWCAGCNRYFGDGKAFELHATGTLRVKTGPLARRCRTESEMRALGLRQLRGTSTWFVPDKPSPENKKP